MFKHVDKTSFTSTLFLLFLKRLLNEDKVSLKNISVHKVKNIIICSRSLLAWHVLLKVLILMFKYSRYCVLPDHSFLPSPTSSNGNHDHVDVVDVVAVILDVEIVDIVVVIIVVVVIVVVVIVDICDDVGGHAARGQHEVEESECTDNC